MISRQWHGLTVMERDPRAVTIVVWRGRIDPRDVIALCARGALLALAHPHRVIFDVGALLEPDVAVVDAIARLQLTLGRLGCELSLRNPSSELRELIDLAGLADVLHCREV